MQCPYCQGEIEDGASRCNRCGSALNAPAAAPAAAAGYQSNFGDQFNAALIIWKMNLGDLAVLTLVLMFVVWIPIANLGFLAGYTRAVQKVMRGEGRAQIGDLFNAWDCFGNLLVYVVMFFIASLIVGMVPLLGALASVALGFVAFPGSYLIIARNSNFADAIKWSLATIQARPVDWVLSYIVGGVVAAAGMLLLGIGLIVTLPLATLIWSQQYENSKPE